jgi:hypothetical protein
MSIEYESKHNFLGAHPRQPNRIRLFLGHSAVALRYKIPVKSITLFIFGGVAQIGAEPPGAISEFWIAIAGPVTSFGLALFLACYSPWLAQSLHC